MTFITGNIPGLPTQYYRKPDIDLARDSSIFKVSLPMEMFSGSGAFSGLRVIPMTSPLYFSEDPDIKKKIAEMKITIATGLKCTVHGFVNKHNLIKGMWYPDDYRAYLLSEFNIEMDEAFSTGYANKKLFEKIDDFTFKLRQGKSAAVAINRFLQGPTVADSLNVIMACYYKCVLDIIGKSKFDALFSAYGDLPLIIGNKKMVLKESSSPLVNLRCSPISCLIYRSSFEDEGVLGKRKLQVGDACYLGGVSWYKNKHPRGFDYGRHVIHIGDNEAGEQLFVGHGVKKPTTEKQLYCKLIESYNCGRSPQDEVFVKNAKDNWYDRETNLVLKNSWTLSLGEDANKVSQVIKKFQDDYVVQKFSPELVCHLDPEKLVRLKMTKNVKRLSQDFIFERE